jgi:hypothetical protein
MPNPNVSQSHFAKAAAGKAATFCEEAKSEASLAVIARMVLEEFDTAPKSQEYLALAAAFSKSHGKNEWVIVDDIVRAFKWFRR